MKKRLLSLLLIAMLLFSGCSGLKAAKTRIDLPGALDRILYYEVTAFVNPDATVSLYYHLDWQVLDSDSEGPLEWVKIGIPNSNVGSIMALTENIDDISYYSSGGNYVRIDFDRAYYKDEIISFSFMVEQDYLYEMNALTDGETVYYFTPGWFNEAVVDKMVVKWSDEYAIGWSSGAYQDGGFIIWETEDLVGRDDERSVTYTSDTYSFDSTKGYEDCYDDYNYYSDYGYYEDSSDDSAAVGAVFTIAFIAVIITIISKISNAESYGSGSGFLSASTKTTVKRTLIKFYPTCPGCGATRKKDQEECEYCGRSFIESEEVLEESEVQNPQDYSRDGLYKYGSTPYTYVRVHVVTPPPRKSTCVHSSCAHSSCACAHSCACACACACAGGGRAGCSTKDFYNTGLKLQQFEKRKKNK